MTIFKAVLAKHAHEKVVGSEELDNAGFLIHDLEEQVFTIAQQFNISNQISWKFNSYF